MDWFVSSRTRSNISKFCWRHRGKIAVTTLGIGAVLGAAYYYYGDEEEVDECEGGNDSDAEEGKENNELSTDNMTNPAAVKKRTSELIAVNDLFDFSLTYFLPTIKQKVKEVVDVTDTVQKLKELMKRDTAPEQHVSKAVLWREIQLSAFNTLLTTAYSVSGASLLLMVQMHILVRHRSRPLTTTELNSADDHSGVFKGLMEKTFGTFFESGISNFAQKNKRLIDDMFTEIGWTVEDTLSVSHDDIKDVLSMMKGRVENGIDGSKSIKDVTSFLFLGQSGHDGINGEGKAESVSFLPSVDVPEASGQSLRVPDILDETWKVLRSSMFDLALLDITEAVFKFLLHSLWEEVFQPLQESTCDFPLTKDHHPGSPNGPAELESRQGTPPKLSYQETTKGSDVAAEHKYRENTIPLAKLLPKLKVAAFRLIPEELSKSKSADSMSDMQQTSEYDSMFTRLSPGSAGVTGPRRSGTVQRIRSFCGADDVRSNCFNLCSMLLEKKLV